MKNKKKDLLQIGIEFNFKQKNQNELNEQN